MSRDPHFLRPGRGIERSGVKRRRKYFLVALISILLLAGAAVLSWLAYQLLTDPDYFKVREILVEGAEFADRDLVVATVHRMTEKNVLLVDLKEVCAAVEKLPWVESARARKILPDSLQLTLSEYIPVAHATLDEDLYLVSGLGEIIDRLRPEHPFVGLPVIRGIDDPADEEARGRLELAAGTLERIELSRPEWLERISELDVGEPGAMRVRLVDRDFDLIVGDEKVIERLDRYFSIEAELERRYDTVKYIDVRFERRLFAGPGTGENRGQTP